MSENERDVEVKDERLGVLHFRKLKLGKHWFTEGSLEFYIAQIALKKGYTDAAQFTYDDYTKAKENTELYRAEHPTDWKTDVYNTFKRMKGEMPSHEVE